MEARFQLLERALEESNKKHEEANKKHEESNKKHEEKLEEFRKETTRGMRKITQRLSALEAKARKMSLGNFVEVFVRKGAELDLSDTKNGIH